MEGGCLECFQGSVRRQLAEPREAWERADPGVVGILSYTPSPSTSVSREHTPRQNLLPRSLLVDDMNIKYFEIVHVYIHIFFEDVIVKMLILHIL